MNQGQGGTRGEGPHEGKFPQSHILEHFVECVGSRQSRGKTRFEGEHTGNAPFLGFNGLIEQCAQFERLGHERRSGGTARTHKSTEPTQGFLALAPFEEKVGQVVIDCRRAIAFQNLDQRSNVGADCTKLDIMKMGLPEHNAHTHLVHQCVD